jgi:hypothetical protein
MKLSEFQQRIRYKQWDLEEIEEEWWTLSGEEAFLEIGEELLKHFTAEDTLELLGRCYTAVVGEACGVP